MRIQPRERRFLECRLAQNSRIFGELSPRHSIWVFTRGLILNPIEYGSAGRLDGGTPGICLRIEDLFGYTGSLT